MAARIARLLLTTALVVGTTATVGLLQPTPAAASSNCYLSCSFVYNGGALEASTHNIVVRWGSAVSTTTAGTAAGLLRDLSGSGYLSPLSEYSETGYAIGAAASYAGTYLITPSTSATTISDAVLQSELAAQIAAGHLPIPSSTTNYFVLFPAGDSITYAGGTSLVDFCAYHNSFTDGSTPVRYEVMPDFNNSTAETNCPGGPTAAGVLTATMSHQLVETITDPEPGSGWYDPNNGELADVCWGSLGSVGGNPVQAWYSNTQADCTRGSASLTLPTKPAATTTQSTASFVFTDNDPFGTSPSFTCRLDSGTAAACLPDTTLTYGSLPDGVHALVVTGTDGASSIGTLTYSWRVDTVAPKPSMSSPSTPVTLATTVATTYSATDAGSGVASYDVRYRVAAWNGSFGSWQLPSAWQHTTHTGESVAGSLGHEYCFSARARDHAGNVSAWSGQRCTAVALDDRSLSATTSGWSKGTSSSYFRGTFTKSTQRGATLKLVGAHLDRLALVVKLCPTCGSLAIYRGGVYWRTVGTSASTTRYRVILTQPTFGTRTTTITLKVASSGKPVFVDGVGISEN